ncbi:hypothetical protein VPH35_081816 [Triticum aestivum]
MDARVMRIIGLQPPRPLTNTPTCSSVQIGLLKKVDSILDNTQPPPSGAHHVQVVRRCHLRPFNYAALRRSPPSETTTSTKTPSHAQCSVRHNTRSSCKTAANIQVHQRIYSCVHIDEFSPTHFALDGAAVVQLECVREIS